MIILLMINTWHRIISGATIIANPIRITAKWKTAMHYLKPLYFSFLPKPYRHISDKGENLVCTLILFKKVFNWK